MCRKAHNFSVISLALLIIFCGCSKREHTNPLDPSNPNSDAVSLPSPAGLKATPDYGAVILTWDPVTYAVGYRIYRDDEQVNTIYSVFYEDTGLMPGKKYKYQIASVHSSGLGGRKSGPVYATPLKGASIKFSKYEIYSDDNDDGIVNRGEVVKVRVYLKNVGTSRANNVTAHLTTTDPYTALSYDEANYYGLDPGEEDYGEALLYSNWSYEFTISDSCPYGHTVAFNLNIQDADMNSWSDTFSITVFKTNANIVYTKYEVYSDDNDDGIVNRGEVVKVRVYLKNVGTSRANNVTAHLTNTDPFITVNYDDANYYRLDPGEEAYGEALLYSYWSYEFTVSSSCPTPKEISFILSIQDEDSNSWPDSFTVPVQ